MPSLIRVYLGGDEIGKFEPRGPQDEAAAQAETDVCNWYLEAKNDTFSQLNATLRDALLLKNGYMVAFGRSRRIRWSRTTSAWPTKKRPSGPGQCILRHVGKLGRLYSLLYHRTHTGDDRRRVPVSLCRASGAEKV